jgi:hypothetical protein
MPDLGLKVMSTAVEHFLKSLYKALRTSIRRLRNLEETVHSVSEKGIMSLEKVQWLQQ